MFFMRFNRSNQQCFWLVLLALAAVTLPLEVTANGIGDIYETDDTQAHANVIVLNDTEAQLHTFHVGSDTDWVKFLAIQGQSYEVRVQNTSPNCDVVLQVIEADGTVFDIDDYLSGENEYHTWQSNKKGLVYAAVSPWSGDQIDCEGTSYELVAYIPSLPTLALFTGTITNSLTGDGVGDALLETNESFSAISLIDTGTYEMLHEPIESGELFVYADGFDTSQTTISAPDADTTVPLDISLSPAVTLEHAVIAIKVLAGLSPGGILDVPDLYSDGQIGMPEAIYVLQRLANVRE